MGGTFRSPVAEAIPLVALADTVPENEGTVRLPVAEATPLAAVAATVPENDGTVRLPVADADPLVAVAAIVPVGPSLSCGNIITSATSDTGSGNMVLVHT